MCRRDRAWIVRPAREAFDKALPDLKKMRDVAEHIDEYAYDAGRHASVARRQLEVSGIDGQDDRRLHWLGSELSTRTAMGAAEALFAVISAAGSELSDPGQ